MIIDKVRFKVDLFVLDTNSIEVIFGMPWLDKVSPTTINCKTLSMKVSCGGKKRELKGFGYNAPRETDSTGMLKELMSGGEVFLLQSESVQGTGTVLEPE